MKTPCFADGTDAAVWPFVYRPRANSSKVIRTGWCGSPLMAALVYSLTGLPAHGAGFFDDSEAECHDAVSRASQCCPELRIDYAECVHEDREGCLRDGTLLSEGESACLQRLDCVEIVKQGLCVKLQARTEGNFEPGPADVPYQQEGTCF